MQEHVKHPRLRRLLERALALADSRKPWERAVWFTRGFQGTDPDEPMVVRRARALKYTLENMPVRVPEDEFFVGDIMRTRGGAPGIADEHAWAENVTAPEHHLHCDPEHVPPDVACEYGVTGCIELAIAGHAECITVSLFANLAKILELALNDGCSLTTGRRVGPATGKPGSFADMPALMGAFSRRSTWRAVLLMA